MSNNFCANCGAPLGPKDTRCDKCGTHVTKAKTDREKGAAPERDPDYGRCEWVAGDRRCRNWGSMSRSTNGSGPWYCAGHFFERDPIIAAQLVDASWGDLGLPSTSIGRAA